MAADSAIRPVGIVMEPQKADEAKGVDIRRTVGSERLVLLDPVLLLDHLNVPAGGPAEVGFPRHPHRGIETLTYVFRGGRVHHGDSLGNDSAVGAGGAQWMTAGGGIFHQEMLEGGADGVEGLQLWFSLPADQKMKPAAYQPVPGEAIPEVALDGGATARVVAGTVAGTTGPLVGIAVDPLYLDVRVPAGASVTLPAPAGRTAFAYLYRGAATFGAGGDGAKAVDESPRLVIFGDGDSVTATAAAGGEARFVFVAAAPLNEPVVQYRSLVMNTVDQMRQAIADLENGTFTQH